MLVEAITCGFEHIILDCRALETLAWSLSIQANESSYLFYFIICVYLVGGGMYATRHLSKSEVSWQELVFSF